MKRDLKIFIAGFIAASVLMFSLNGFAESAMKSIEVVFNKVNLAVNGKPVPVDNILYNNTTYVPLRAVAEMLGKEVKWDGGTNTVNISDSTTATTQKSLELHTFYAIKSYDQFKSLINGKSINTINSLGFGWSRMEYDEKDKKVSLNMRVTNNNDFYLPQGFSEVVKNAKDAKIATQLSVYADKNLKEILENKEDAIKEIVTKVNNVQLDEESTSFDGVVIDFEGLPEQERTSFTDFLKDLKKELDLSKKSLYVTVPPKRWNNSYDYKAIGEVADRIILMAHDYDAKSLSAITPYTGSIYTPLAPIGEVRQALKDITESGVKDLSKILLQINFATTQWKIKDGKLYDNDGNNQDGIINPDKPTYDMVYNRIKQELAGGKAINQVINFDEPSKSPFIKYISATDGMQNIIWYEDSLSVEAKINLAKEFGIGGISLWRLGNIPSNGDTLEMNLNVWQQVQKAISQ